MISYEAKTVNYNSRYFDNNKREWPTRIVYGKSYQNFGREPKITTYVHTQSAHKYIHLCMYSNTIFVLDRRDHKSCLLMFTLTLYNMYADNLINFT